VKGGRGARGGNALTRNLRPGGVPSPPPPPREIGLSRERVILLSLLSSPPLLHPPLAGRAARAARTFENSRDRRILARESADAGSRVSRESWNHFVAHGLAPASDEEPRRRSDPRADDEK